MESIASMTRRLKEYAEFLPPDGRKVDKGDYAAAQRLKKSLKQIVKYAKTITQEVNRRT